MLPIHFVRSDGVLPIQLPVPRIMRYAAVQGTTLDCVAQLSGYPSSTTTKIVLEIPSDLSSKSKIISKNLAAYFPTTDPANYQPSYA